MTRQKSLFSLIVRALFPRLLFLFHGLICVWFLVKQEENTNYWYLVFCLGALVCEGIFNAVVRHGKEFHWFCPSAFFYCVVLITTMTTLRVGQIPCLHEEVCSRDKLKGDDVLVTMVNDWGTTYAKRISIIEQSGLLILIIGRWLLPQGTISKDQFSQILLIYIGTAADIVEFSEIYGEDDLEGKLGKDLKQVLSGLMVVWALSVMQFSLTIALPEEGLKTEEKEDDDEEEAFQETSYFRSKIQNKVAPMSYMHYKSMMRDTFSVDNQPATTNNRKTLLKNAFTAQNGFRNHSELIKQNSKQNLGEMSQDNRKLKQPTGSYRTPPIMLRELQKRYTNDDQKIILPHGERVPRNVGSPQSLRSLRMTTSSQSNRSRKDVGSAAVSIRSRKNDSPQSLRSIHSNNGSTGSKRKNKLSNNTNPDPSLLKRNNTFSKLVQNLSLKKEKQIKRKDSTKEDNSLGIGKKEMKNCFIEYLDLIGILLPVCMQDGPFLIARFVLVAHYEVITEMIFLLIVKNALVIIVQIYRILLMYCTEPKVEPEIDDASVRVRNAMYSQKKFSDNRLRTQKASIAIQAISRMHHLYEKGEQSRKITIHDETNEREVQHTVIDLPTNE